MPWKRATFYLTLSPTAKLQETYALCRESIRTFRDAKRRLYFLFPGSHSISHPLVNANFPMQLGEMLGGGTEGRAGGANTDECTRSDYTVMDGTKASVNTSRQGSMQLSSPPQCSFDPARPGLPRRNLCLTGAAQTGNWEPCLALQGGSFHDLGRYQDPAWNVP